MIGRHLAPKDLAIYIRPRDAELRVLGTKWPRIVSRELDDLVERPVIHRPQHQPAPRPEHAGDLVQRRARKAIVVGPRRVHEVKGVVTEGEVTVHINEDAWVAARADVLVEWHVQVVVLHRVHVARDRDQLAIADSLVGGVGKLIGVSGKDQGCGVRVGVRVWGAGQGQGEAAEARTFPLEPAMSKTRRTSGRENIPVCI